MTRRSLAPERLRGDWPAQLAHFTSEQPNGCWEFTGYIDAHGYGQIGRDGKAHRIAWAAAHGGPVPDGLVVDHICHNADPECADGALCRHRRCVNPEHLEAVSPGANVLRGKSVSRFNGEKTHCSKGHAFDAENTYRRPDRLTRECRACRRETMRQYAAKARA